MVVLLQELALKHTASRVVSTVYVTRLAATSRAFAVRTGDIHPQTPTDHQ